MGEQLKPDNLKALALANHPCPLVVALLVVALLSSFAVATLLVVALLASFAVATLLATVPAKREYSNTASLLHLLPTMLATIV